MPIVRKLMYYRIKNGLSRHELAELIDRTYVMIKQYEHGIRPLTPTVKGRLKEILGVDGSITAFDRIEISDEEYTKYRKYFRMGPAERVSPTMIYFLGKHFPVKSLEEVATRIRERKQARLREERV